MKKSVFSIKASQGTGKTVYVHYLKNRYSDAVDFHILDLEKATGAASLKSVRFEIQEDKWDSNLY
jgi:hypothetical protein